MQDNVRYNIPTRYDIFPYATVLKVVGDRGQCVYYIQTSKDPETMHWERSGYIFEKIYNHRLGNEVNIEWYLNSAEIGKELTPLDRKD